MRRALLALVAFAVLVTVVPAAASTPTEPWLDEDFADTSTAFGSMAGLRSIDGHVGNGVASVIPRGRHWGSTGHWNLAANGHAGAEELYWRYWLRFPDGFRVDAPARGKLPGPAGLYTYNCLGGRPSTPSAPCWSARMLFSPLNPGEGTPKRSVDVDAVTRIGSYVYHLDGPSNRGDVLLWDVDVATLDHGSWYCVEGRIDLNTPGERDGVLQGWVDGKAAYSRSDLRFRRSGEPNIDVKSFWFDVYYGGSQTSPVANQIHFDSLVVDDQRIGCDDSTGGRGTFTDDDDSIFESDIEWLAATGITKGCDPPSNTRFCPDQKVTRGQMAAFLHRALDQILDVPSAPPEPPPPPTMWGVSTNGPYKEDLDRYASFGAVPELYRVAYRIDSTDAGNNWLGSGNTDPPHWVPLQLEHVWSRGATPLVEIRVQDLPGLVSGALDVRLEAVTATLGDWVAGGGGRRLVVDVLPDGNDRYRDWGDDPSRYKPAFRRVVDRLRADLPSDAIRTVYTSRVDMRSSRHSFGDHRHGYELFFPGEAWVDVAALSGFSSGQGWADKFGPRTDELAGVVGPEIPVIASLAGAVDDAYRDEFVDGLISHVEASPQFMGWVWPDIVRSNLDLAVSNSTGLDADFSRLVAASGGGTDWLFSNAFADWRAARASMVTFTDTGASVFRADIGWLARAGITKGCSPTEYCPEDPVKRQEMAAFLDRALRFAPAPAGNRFRDDTGIFEDQIERLAHAGVTRGCNPPANDLFCPSNPVTRGQMAAFLRRALGGVLGG